MKSSHYNEKFKPPPITRREAIRNIALVSVATILLPGCGDVMVNDLILEGILVLDRKHTKYLSSMSEMFLPLEGRSGAIGDPVPFIMSMLNDCSRQRVIEDFATGFEQYKTLMKECSVSLKNREPEEVVHIVETVLAVNPPDDELVHFINTVKGRSIEYLTTSEFYLTEYLDFEMIPAAYNPCLDIK